MRYIGTTPNQYGDTLLTSDANDQINVKVAGAEDFRIAANTLSVLSGTTLNIDSGATIANSGTATGFGSGGVDTSGTPADNQLAIFTDADTVEGDSNLTYDGTDLILAGGNINVDSGNGIDFSANANLNAGMSSELFHAYEEGTYIATVVCATSGSFTTAWDTVGYTVIGNRCFVNGHIDVNGESSPVGAIKISLPMTVAGGTVGTSYARVPCHVFNHGGTLANTAFFFQPNESYLNIYLMGDDGTETSLDKDDVDTAWSMSVHVTFPV